MLRNFVIFWGNSKKYNKLREQIKFKEENRYFLKTRPIVK